MKELCAELLEQVRKKRPLVHHITNYVTVNECANITLAVGASPIMADALEEALDISALSSALVLNIGTLNERVVPSMLAAGVAANRAGAPVVFDPVGAGASRMRSEVAKMLLYEIKVDILRGNISEICHIAGMDSKTQGVDASEDDMRSIADAVFIAKELAARLGCIVAITGATDVVSDGGRTLCIRNGHPMLGRITGTGCMCSSLVGALCGASPDMLLGGSVAALLTMGIAGEIAYKGAGVKGNGSFRTALHDAVSRIDARTLESEAKLYEA